MKMPKLKQNYRLQAFLAVFMATLVFVGGITIPRVNADQYDQQIKNLRNQNAANQVVANQLADQADSYQTVIDRLQQQINTTQAQINDSQAKIDKLRQQIADAEAELLKNRTLLGKNIRAMYVEGDISTLEMLASSKDLSEFFDKQAYRTSVQDKIKTTLDKINAIKAELREQKTQVETKLGEQKVLQAQLQDNQSQQSQLLSYTEAQKSQYEQQIRQNNSQIQSLRAQQAAAIAAISGSNGTSAVGSSIVYRNLSGGVQCGGGYAYCTYGLDQWVSDPWGLFLARECVHYVAWGLSQRGINVHFNGNGNANQWQYALSGMATVNNDPNGAQMVYLPIGSLGHVAMVDHNYGDGWVGVSQYNWQPGMYSTMDLKVTPNLLFFHF